MRSVNFKYEASNGRATIFPLPFSQGLSTRLVSGFRMRRHRYAGRNFSAPEGFHMLSLTVTNEAIAQIQKAFDDAALAAKNLSLLSPDWTRQILGQIATWAETRKLKSCARGKPGPCTSGEFLFDFCALFEDPSSPQGHTLTYPEIVGEIEWGNEDEVYYDFEKLFFTCAPICFLGFMMKTQDQARLHLAGMKTAVECRRAYLRQRGMLLPPVFSLSCLTLDTDEFLHDEVK
jgi:hypothetical protein